VLAMIFRANKQCFYDFRAANSVTRNVQDQIFSYC
jgi:hypothetical protein